MLKMRCLDRSDTFLNIGSLRFKDLDRQRSASMPLAGETVIAPYVRGTNESPG
jgi:hypothetical protein